MDSWNEPISFSGDGKPNDSLSKYEANKNKLKKAPLQVNNDGTVTPLNPDGSPLDGSSYKRPEMSEESEGWKLNDQNAFNGKYDDVMDLDVIASPPISKESWKGYSPNNAKIAANSSMNGVPGKLVVEKIMPDGSLMHEKTYEPGEIINLSVENETIDHANDIGIVTVSYQGKTIYTVKTAYGFDKYSSPPFKMTYTMSMKKKTTETDIDEALAVAAELPEEEPTQPWAQGSTSQEIIDAIKKHKKAYETPQPVMSPAEAYAIKAMTFSQIYGASTQTQEEIYKKYLQKQFISSKPAPTYKVPKWADNAKPVNLPPVDPSEYEEESDDDKFYDEY